MDVEERKQGNVDKREHIGAAKKAKKLTPKQKLFCKLYATDREFFGNGTQSYIEAFSTETKKVNYSNARTQASKLLTNPNILACINKLLEVVLNDAHVDKQMAFLITQNTELNVKLGAIKEYNALKKRIVKKMEIEASLTFTEALNKAIHDNSG